MMLTNELIDQVDALKAQIKQGSEDADRDISEALERFETASAVRSQKLDALKDRRRKLDEDIAAVEDEFQKAVIEGAGILRGIRKGLAPSLPVVETDKVKRLTTRQPKGEA